MYTRVLTLSSEQPCLLCLHAPPSLRPFYLIYNVYFCKNFYKCHFFPSIGPFFLVSCYSKLIKSSLSFSILMKYSDINMSEIQKLCLSENHLVEIILHFYQRNSLFMQNPLCLKLNVRHVDISM